MGKPSKVIALEEHFLLPGVPPSAAVFDHEGVTRFLTDFDLRIEIMDRYGIDTQVISHSGPPWRGPMDVAGGRKLARAANDFVADIARKYPKRIEGFAALPVQDGKAAAEELDYAVTQLGLKGALINGQTNGEYLDADQYLPMWERAAALDVPVYLHPGPPPSPMPVTKGFPSLESAMWGWTAETGAHTLRLILSGLFDRFPKLTVIVGHMGETLPFLLWRMDSRFLRRPPVVKLDKLPSAYIRENIMITTSGVFSNEPLLCAVAALGIDRVMFSVDYPHEETEPAAAWIAQVPLPQADVEKIAHGNAERILKL